MATGVQRVSTLLSFSTLLFCLVAATAVRSASVDNNEAVRQARPIIEDYSNTICTKWSTETRTSKIETSGEANGGLKSLLKHLADIGISVAAHYEKEEAFGPLRSDLAKAVAEADKCRLDVTRLLLPILLSPTPNTEPALRQQTKPKDSPPPETTQQATIDDIPSIYRVPAVILLDNPNYFYSQGNDLYQPYKVQAYKDKMKDLGKLFIEQIREVLEKINSGTRPDYAVISRTLLEMSRSAELFLQQSENFAEFIPNRMFFLAVAMIEVGTFSNDYTSRMQALERANPTCEQFGNMVTGNVARSAVISTVAGCQANVLNVKALNFLAVSDDKRAITTFRAAAEKARKFSDNPLMEAEILRRMAMVQSRSSCSDAQKTFSEMIKVLDRTGNLEQIEFAKEQLSQRCILP